MLQFNLLANDDTLSTQTVMYSMDGQP